MTRFADIQLLRYRVPEFETLSLTQKLYIFYLSEAALWGRDILWDQNGKHNLSIRDMLEKVYCSLMPADGDWSSLGENEKALHTYLRQVWFANGIHHHYSTDKFTPQFSREWFEQYADGNEELLDIIFDEKLLPKRVCQSGEDLIKASASNYYGADVTQKDAENFYAKMEGKGTVGINSRLEKHENELRENVYRIGGLYSEAIEKISECLNQALTYAENDKQRRVIETLLEFYKTGDLKTFDRYTIEWVEETEGFVDFINGFTETYGDPLGIKASWEGYVNYRDEKATRRTEILSKNAQWFEDNSPVDARFKKRECRGISARVVNAAILAGDLYPASAIGINLPNNEWIRTEYGSKSVTIGNLTAAYEEAAVGNGFREEFVLDEATRILMDKYCGITDDLHTDLHECLGHGSGRLLPDTNPDALGVYGATIEEARADLFGLYYIADPKLVELGILPAQAEEEEPCWHAQYYSYIMNGLMTQLVRILPGCVIEESHMRNRAMICHWLLKHCESALRMINRDGKTYVEITDYDALRDGIGILLSEVQRIKSEGDYKAAHSIVETHGVSVDSVLHAEVLQRYKSLNLAPYKGFVNPRYTLKYDAKGNPCDVLISYDEEYDEQMLRYSREYRTLNQNG